MGFNFGSKGQGHEVANELRGVPFGVSDQF